MNEQELLKALSEYNTFWTTSKVEEPKLKEFRRRDFYSLSERLEDDRIIAIMGPRRIGKTTVMYQLIDDLINIKKIAPKRILYVSLDSAYINSLSERPILDVMEVYSKFILQEQLKDIKFKVYVFLDEIHFIENWEVHLKTLYDLYPKVKFIVSGSSSLYIKEGSSALVGRLDYRIMLPLKFVDFLNYKAGIEGTKSIFNQLNRKLREALLIAIIKNNGRFLFNKLNRYYPKFVNMENKIKVYLNEHLLKGGYPELLDIDNYSVCSDRIKDSWRLSLYDIIRKLNVRDPSALEELCSLLAGLSSNRINYASLANTLSIQRLTVKQYINNLKHAFLISLSEYYSRDRSSRYKKEKKVYINDVGLRNAILNSMNEDLLKDASKLGEVIETLVFEHTVRLRFHLEGGREHSLFYWHDNYYEIDFILLKGKTAIPIETKYQDMINENDIKIIKKFIERYKSPFGIVITKNKLDFKEKILYVPLWLYLVMC